MACLGYFFKYRAGLRTPRTNAYRDKFGIHWEGKVTQGELGVDEALKLDDESARLTPEHLQQERDGRFGRQLDHDPVLAFHSKKF